MSTALLYHTAHSPAFENIVVVDFVLSLVIFLGALYVLLRNEKLPKWHVTPLWYLGTTSLLSALSIVFEWMLGKDFPLSYYNVGVYLDIATKAFLAWIAITFFTVTFFRRIKAGTKKPTRKRSLLK